MYLKKTKTKQKISTCTPKNEADILFCLTCLFPSLPPSTLNQKNSQPSQDRNKFLFSSPFT